MHPILIKIGNFPIYSYGIMLTLSFLVGLRIVEHRAKKIGIKSTVISDLAIWILVSVIIGSRLLYVVFHWSEFARDPIEIIALWRGGLAGLMFYGGFLLALMVGIWYVTYKKLPMLKLLDAIAPAVALGEFFTRIGCFLNGCCFGVPTQLPWGIKFPDHSAAGYHFDVPVHPTQLYSSLAGLLIFLFVLRLEKLKPQPGIIFSIFLFLYSGYRFLVDFIRFYENTSNFLVNQILSVALMAIAVSMFIILKKRTAT